MNKYSTWGKTDWMNLRAQCAKDLGLTDVKDQKAHGLMVVRVLKGLTEEFDGDWTKAYGAFRTIGHGLGCNASQFNQWLDKAEGGVKAEVMADLMV